MVLKVSLQATRTYRNTSKAEKVKQYNRIITTIKNSHLSRCALSCRGGLHEAEQVGGSRPLVPRVPQVQARPHPCPPHLWKTLVHRGRSHLTVSVETRTCKAPRGEPKCAPAARVH